MGVIDRLFAKQIDIAVERKVGSAENKIIKSVNETLLKSSYDGVASSPVKAKRYQVDPSYYNANQSQRMKPGSSISFDTLRRFSKMHEISRACINVRKRQITGLEWDIVATDTEDTNTYDNDVAEVKQWFKNIGGNGIGYRKFLNKFIEDILVLDAISLYKQFTFGGELYTLIPIDAATIRLVVDESGGMPLPPEVAFKQYIRGQLAAEYTSDEMIYDMMNPANDTPYGLAPLESLIVVVSSSLKAGMYNLGYLTDGNIPEGFVTVPDTWTPQMIQTFQQNFDAALAGDETATSRLKMLPGGGGYIPTKKRDDMQFAEFNDWLMKVTCALFEVQPKEIGFLPKTGLGGKGMEQGQDGTTTRKAILPLTKFIREIFDRIIQEDLGRPYLRFEFKGLEDRDARSEAEINEILIRSGQRTINEVRTDDGVDPIEGLDKPLFAGTFQFVDQESLQEAADQKQQAAEAQAQMLDQNNQSDNTNQDNNQAKSADITAEVVNDLRKYRRYALGRIKEGKSLRKFESMILPANVVEEINKKLDNCKDPSEAKQIFSKYFNDMQINFLADVIEFKQALNRIRE